MLQEFLLQVLTAGTEFRGGGGRHGELLQHATLLAEVDLVAVVRSLFRWPRDSSAAFCCNVSGMSRLQIELPTAVPPCVSDELNTRNGGLGLATSCIRSLLANLERHRLSVPEYGGLGPYACCSYALKQFPNRQPAQCPISPACTIAVNASCPTSA